jgi:hypothetical protein
LGKHVDNATQELGADAPETKSSAKVQGPRAPALLHRISTPFALISVSPPVHSLVANVAVVANVKFTLPDESLTIKYLMIYLISLFVKCLGSIPLHFVATLHDDCKMIPLFVFIFVSLVCFVVKKLF